MPAKNLLIVMADQMTPFAVGAYGNTTVKTPHIDQLAREGVRFDAAYCNSPLCTPARYAFMTGQLGSRTGGYDNASYMPSTTPTFAHYLRMMGYRTELAGKMHFVGPDQLHGFEERHTTDVYPADFGWVPDWTQADERIDLWYHNMSSVVQAGPAAITNQLAYDDEVGASALRAIYAHARTPKHADGRPLCLVASFIHPHDPYAARRSYWDLYTDSEIALPAVAKPDAGLDDPHSHRLRKAIACDAVDINPAQVRAARRAYFANVSYVDDWLGRLKAALTECGLGQNTTVIFLADHGDMLGERGLWYKMSFYEWSARIPMIIWSPSRFAPAVVQTPVSQVDILPTLTRLAAEATGNAQPTPIEPLAGKDLVTLADSAASAGANEAVSDGASDRRMVVCEYLAEAAPAPMLMLRQGNYKYTCCPADPEQLFDLHADPNELINLADATRAPAGVLQTFQEFAASHWDAEALKAQVIADQNKRRQLSQALRLGRYQSWDWEPRRDAAGEYTRSHLELSSFDHDSRYPRPPAFNPRFR